MKELFLIIPVHNRRQISLDFLQLLQRQSFREFETVIVDAGSTDGTFEAISESFSEVHIVKGNNSWWWTKSVNEGCKFAVSKNAKCVILLNDDTSFDNTYIENLVTDSKNNPLSVIGTVLITDEDNPKIYFSGTYSINKITGVPKVYFERFHEFKEDYKKEGLKPSLELTGSGLLVPTEIFSKIGYLDELNFPHYLSDYDYVLRANRAGFITYISYHSVTKTNLRLTGKGSSFIKQSLVEFIKAYGYEFSRNNYKKLFIYYKRHYHNILFVLPYLIHLITSFRRFFNSKKY